MDLLDLTSIWFVLRRLLLFGVCDDSSSKSPMLAISYTHLQLHKVCGSAAMLASSTFSNESWPYHIPHNTYLHWICTISSFSPELGRTAASTIHRMGRAHWAPPAWLFRHSWTRALSCHLRPPGFLIIQTQTSNNISKISSNNQNDRIINFYEKDWGE